MCKCTVRNFEVYIIEDSTWLGECSTFSLKNTSTVTDVMKLFWTHVECLDVETAVIGRHFIRKVMERHIIVSRASEGRYWTVK